MEKHPDLAHRKLRVGMGHAKFKKLWVELSDIANSINGAVKSTKGWIKVIFLFYKRSQNIVVAI